MIQISNFIRKLLFLPLFISFNNYAEEVDLFILSLEDLLKVEVSTAGKTSQTLADVTQTAYVINAQQIAEQGHRSIMGAIASLPGFFMQRDWYLDDLVIRGQEQTDEKFLLLVDGQAMTMRSDNYNILNGAAPVSMADIDKIEVIMGPSSTLYGSGAYLGVVNVITQTADDGMKVSSKISSVNEKNIHVQFGKRFADFNLTTSAEYIDNDGSDLTLFFPDGAPPSYNQKNIKADGYNTLESKRVSAKLESENLWFRAQYSDSKIGWPSAIFATDINDHENFYQIKHQSIQGQHKQQWNDEIQATTRVYYTDSAGDWHGVYEDELWLAPRGEIYGGKYVGAEYRINYQPSDKVSITSGVEYTHNHKIQSVFFFQDFDNHSIFALLNYHLNEELKFTLGGRSEKYSYFEEYEFLPQVGLNYTPNQESTIKLNYSQGFIAPSTWQLQVQDDVNNSNITPELFDSYEMSYRYIFDNWSSNLTLFWSEESDKITINFDGNTPDSIYNSANINELKGAEWSVDMMYSDQTTLKASLSYVDAEKHTRQGHTALEGSVKLLGSFSLRTVFNNNSVLTIYNKFVGDTEGITSIGSWNRTDVSWQVPDVYGFALVLKVNNIFDADIVTNDVASGAEVIPDYGRNFSLMIKKGF